MTTYAAEGTGLPLNRDSLALDSSPRSVQDARSWIGGLCRELGRDDLAETAELGVSELVTNALLHGTPPISVRLRGTRDHPRVEVFDGSHEPPAPNLKMTDDDELLSTIGRGLGIVAMCSDAWGAEIHPNGKVVWFEPAAAIGAEGEVPGNVYDFASVPRPRQGGELANGVEIHLEGIPIPQYAEFRRRYSELRRELRILSLAHSRDYPVAKTISEHFHRYDTEFAVSRGVDQLEGAVETGVERLDVTLTVPRSHPATMRQMIELLELADAFCRAERLLTLATTPDQLDFQLWFLGEFVAQGKGSRPTAWRGPVRPQAPSPRRSSPSNR
jgi:anti-sigma regulatory factor (Ser/Thr protein kinase)